MSALLTIINWARTKEGGSREWNIGVSNPGSFKLDHLQPVELI